MAVEEEEEEQRKREEKVLKLFGVMIHGGCNEEEEKEEEEEEMMRKCWSMSNLDTCTAAAATTPSAGAGARDQNYLSDGGLDESSRKGGRRRGTPWTEEEHRTFLAGLEKLGKGDWRGISREFVRTRTPTQVASHAQKYFLRKNNPAGKRRRRSSLFDLTPHHHQAASDDHHIEPGGVNHRVQGGARLVKDESITTSSLMPFSQKADSADHHHGLTLPHSDCPTLSAEANDLELRIALPQPLPYKVGKLSSQGGAGNSSCGSSSRHFTISDASILETMGTGTCVAPRLLLGKKEGTCVADADECSACRPKRCL